MNDDFLHKLDTLARRALPFFITVGLALISVVPLHLPTPVPVTPALAMSSIFYWAVHDPESLPAPAVFMVGLLVDILTGLPIGISAFVLLVLYGVVVSQRRFFVGKGFIVLWWGFASVALAMGALQWVVLSVFAGEVMGIGPIIVKYLVTAALYPVLTYMLVVIHRNLLREA